MLNLCNSSSSDLDLDTHEQLLLLRDGMLFSLLWKSCFRGFNAGSLRLDNILLPDGASAVPFLTRPSAVGTKRFAEKPMTCSNAWQRLTKSLKALGIYSGQRVHSTSRGHMIHKQQHLHESHKEIADAAMCNEQNAMYHAKVRRPTRFRSNEVSQVNLTR